MRSLLVIGLLAVLAVLSVQTIESNDEAKDDPLEVVRQYQSAFNKHDTSAMLGLAHEEIQWLSVSGSEISLETEGHGELKAGMSEYFTAIPSARSEIEEAIVTGPFVSVRERAFWKSGEKENSQAALAVYEVRDGRIERVWYFAAQK